LTQAAQVLTGGCLCGRIRYRAEGVPTNRTHCHCETCRRASGAPFVSWASFPSAGFTYTQGEPGRYDSSPSACREFCRDCGTQLVFRMHSLPQEVDVTLASLDDPERIVPEDHIWTRRQIGWIHLDDRLPRYPGNREEGGA
jgi:hypothetical protein